MRIFCVSVPLRILAIFVVAVSSGQPRRKRRWRRRGRSWSRRQRRSSWRGPGWRRRRCRWHGQHQRSHPRGMLVHSAASELNTQPFSRHFNIRTLTPPLYHVHIIRCCMALLFALIFFFFSSFATSRPLCHYIFVRFILFYFIVPVCLQVLFIASFLRTSTFRSKCKSCTLKSSALLSSESIFGFPCM